MPKLNIFNHLQTRGVDMKSNPLLLGNRKLHAATNMVFEEGVFRTRPEFEYIPLGSTGTFQGASAYKPSKGLSYAPLSDTPDGLLTVVSGAVFFNKVGDCEGERISRAVFCDKGDVNIFQAEDYAIFQNKQTSTYWWRGEDDIVESPGDLGERWDDREMPETNIQPVAPVASIPVCEPEDGLMDFLILNNTTEEPIPGASFTLKRNGNIARRATSDTGGRFSFTAKDRSFTYTLEKEGFETKTDIAITFNGARSYTIRMVPIDTGYPAVLVLVLDQTGSIGAEGAARGIEIIDQTDVEAVGYVSFGDAVVQSRAITTDLATVRAELVYAVEHPYQPPFFGDDGGDFPENGVDAIKEGLNLLAAFTGVPGGQRALFFKTDTKGYAHNVNNPATVNTLLNQIDAAWLEFTDTSYGTDEGFYEDAFPESAVVSHSTFPLFI